MRTSFYFDKTLIPYIKTFRLKSAIPNEINVFYFVGNILYDSRPVIIDTLVLSFV